MIKPTTQTYVLFNNDDYRAGFVKTMQGHEFLTADIGISQTLNNLKIVMQSKLNEVQQHTFASSNQVPNTAMILYPKQKLVTSF